MAESLKDKTVKGVAWSSIDNVVQIGVTFVVSIVLARLLSPDDYGLIGIVTIFTAVCQILINAGFTNALIRKKDAADNDYNTVFIVNLALSIFLYLVIFFSSPFIAKFFGRVELVWLTRIASLTMIVGALSLVQQTLLTKRIDFKSQTKITLIASVSSGLIGVIMALFDYGVWSLVAQQLSYQIFRTICLWFINKWIPRLEFSMESFRELFGFGWKIMLSSILNTIWNELYQVVVGKFYSPATLGQYTRAKQFSHLFSKNLNTIIQRVTFPVLSNIQDDKTRLVSAYRRIIKATMFVAAIAMITLGAISEPLLHCLIGPKWLEASNYLPLICLSGSFYPLHSINLNMLQVQGRSDLFLVLEILKKIIALGPLFIGAFIGIMPMLYTSIVTNVIAYFLNSYYSGQLIGYSSWSQLKDVAPSYIIAICIALPVYFLKYLPLSNWIILPLQIGVALLIFFILCNIIRKEEYIELKGIATSYIKKITKKTITIR
jgi:O-antigen/teichoic acid export membrane protein